MTWAMGRKGAKGTDLADRLEKAAQVGRSVDCGGVNSVGLDADSHLTLSSSVTPLLCPDWEAALLQVPHISMICDI